MYPASHQHLVEDEVEDMCRGGSLIVSPLGEIIAGPLYDTNGILTAELDLDDVVKSKLDFDVIGHYSRDDIFEFFVKGQPEIKKDFS